MMELKTKAELIRTFPEKWERVFYFFRGNKWSGKDKEVYTRLLALPENRTEQQLKDITGEIGERWLENRCDECRQDVAVVVILGGAVEEGPQCQVCPQCLGAALNLAQTPETSKLSEEYEDLLSQRVDGELNKPQRARMAQLEAELSKRIRDNKTPDLTYFASLFREMRPPDAHERLAALYNLEINWQLNTFWDNGYVAALGDELNGFVEKRQFDSLSDAISWLWEAAFKHRSRDFAEREVRHIFWHADECGPYWTAQLLRDGKVIGTTGNYYDVDENNQRPAKEMQCAELQKVFGVDCTPGVQSKETL